MEEYCKRKKNEDEKAASNKRQLNALKAITDCQTYQDQKVILEKTLTEVEKLNRERKEKVKQATTITGIGMVSLLHLAQQGKPN